MTHWQWIWIVIAVGVGTAAAAATGVWWLWWRLPKRQVRGLEIHDPKARADAEDNFRKTVGQALGGAAVLVGAGFALVQFLQQQKDAQDLRISNQVSKGFEQLAGEKVAMRLGGVYGLEGVMNTSSDYHQPVLEALCAFVRDGTIGKIISGRPSTDIQAALTVIGRRKEGPGEVDLAEANLSKANLIEVDLSGANLSRANLSEAVLINAVLYKTVLIGANLRGAVLTGAKVVEASFLRTDLTDADLRGIRLGDPAVLNEACGTRTKGLPPGVTLNPCPELPPHRAPPGN